MATGHRPTARATIRVLLALTFVAPLAAPKHAAAQGGPPGQGECSNCTIAATWCTWEGNDFVCYPNATVCEEGYEEGFESCMASPPYGSCTVEDYCETEVAMISLPEGVLGPSSGISLASVVPCLPAPEGDGAAATVVLLESGRGTFSEDPVSSLAWLDPPLP